MSERESLLVLWGLAAQPTTGSITSNDLLQKTRDHTRNLPPLNFCLYDLPHKISIKKVAATAGSVCLLSDCGSLFSWGTSCGHGANTPTLPLKLEILSSHFITRLASGSGHFLCSTEAGVVYSWGRGNSCLGHGAGVSNLQFPTVVETLHGEVVVDVAATSFNSFAITKSKCYAWGHTGGLLGVGSPDNLGSPLPQHCPSLQGEMKGIFSGLTHVAVLVDERVYMWGSNGRGESCPTSDQNPIAIPRELESLGDGRTISSMALGNEFSLALTTDGKVFGWGANDSGQLGVGATKPTMPRVQIPALSSRVVGEVFAGRSTAACRTNNNEYFSWGINETGQLGHRDTQTWTVPRRIVTASILNDNYLSPTYLNFSLHCSLSTMAFESLSSSGETDAIGVLLHDIGSQFNEEEISDIVIQVGDQKIYASKFILYSRSEYFRALFKSNMKEAAKGIISIEDFCYDAVLEMVRYLYTGSCKMDPEIALQILEIGMKYQLPDLVAQTESYLEEFTLDSVFPILIEADRLSALSIRENAIRFILNHWGYLARSPTIANLPTPLLLELIRLSADLKSSESPEENEGN